MRSAQFADAQNKLQQGGVMGERCSEMRCIKLPSLSVDLFLRSINKPVIFTMGSFAQFRL